MSSMEETVVQLFRQMSERRFGKFRGIVRDNQDPEKRGRLRIRVASVLGDEESDWALPCLPFGGGKGFGLFTVPEVGAQVWVEFEEGDIHRPIWTGTFWQAQDDVPEDASKAEPTTRMLRTPAGHILQFDDEAGEERFRLFHPADAEVEVDKSGSISLTDASGARVNMDADASKIVVEDANGNTLTMDASGSTLECSNGHRIEMTGGGVTVEATTVTVKASSVDLGGTGGEPLIKGTSFLSLFASHVHTVAPVVGGPTSPPIPQGEASSLSTTVKTT